MKLHRGTARASAIVPLLFRASATRCVASFSLSPQTQVCVIIPVSRDGFVSARSWWSRALHHSTRCLSRLGPRIRTLTLDIARDIRPLFSLPPSRVPDVNFHAGGDKPREFTGLRCEWNTRRIVRKEWKARWGPTRLDVEQGEVAPAFSFFPHGDNNPYCRLARSPSYVIGREKERFATEK